MMDNTFNVGDTVWFDDAYEEGIRYKVNFRGYEGTMAVVVWEGKQLMIEKDRIHAEMKGDR